MIEPDPQIAISLTAAFTAGVLGSVHCFAMCGGLAGALGMRARAVGQLPQRLLMHALLNQLGRVTSYALVGAIAGAIGGTLAIVMQWIHFATALRIAAGCVLLAIALRIAFGWNAFALLERTGGRVWSRYFAKIAPRNSHASQVSPQVTYAQSFSFGAVWGWLPCGLVYSMLVFAVFAGTALHGALVMLAFGAGTLPSMLSSTLLAAQLTRVLKKSSVRLMAAAMLAMFGVWTIVMALQHQGHAH